MVLAEQIKEAASRRDTLEKCLDIERKRMDLQNEEEKTQEPDFWDDAARAQEQLRRVASIKSWITDYDTIRKEVADLTVLATEKVARKSLTPEDQKRLVEEALGEVDFSALAGDEATGASRN